MEKMTQNTICRSCGSEMDFSDKSCPSCSSNTIKYRGEVLINKITYNKSFYILIIELFASIFLLFINVWMGVYVRDNYGASKGFIEGLLSIFTIESFLIAFTGSIFILFLLRYMNKKYGGDQ